MIQNRCLAGIAAAVVLLNMVASGGAVAQEASFPVLPPSGDCPNKESIRMSPNGVWTGDKNWVVAFTDAVGTTSPAANSTRTTSRPGWNQAVQALLFDPVSGTMLVQDIASGKCFYILRDKLLDFDAPFKVGGESGSLVSNSKAYDPSNPAHRKVLIRNDSDPSQVAKGAVVYDSDLNPAGPIVHFFEVYLVFGQKNIRNQEYLFLGGWEDRAGYRIPKPLGWVREIDTIRWPNRMTLSSGPMGKDITVYSEMTTASDHMGTLANISQEATDHTYTRPPILDWQRVSRAASWFAIAFAGGATRPDADQLTPAEVSDLQDNVRGKTARIRNADIVFLIDNTESMKDYFPHVVAAVTQFSQRNGANGYRYGAAAYGDYTDPRGSLNSAQYSQIGDLLDVGVTRSVEKLRSQQTFSDPNGDVPEAMLAAILRTVREFHWRPNSAEPKIIVLIGDDGARNPGEVTSANNVSDPVTTGIVARELATKGIFLYAINVRGEGHSAGNKRFRDQIEEIATASNGKNAELKPGFDIAKPPQPGEMRAVEEALTSILNETFGSQKRVEDFVFHEVVRPSGNSSSGSMLTFDKWWMENNLSPEVVNELRNRRQLVKTGFVRGTEGQFDFYMALEWKELSSIRTAMQNLCHAFESPDRSRAFDEAERILSEGASGDRYGGIEDIADFLKRNPHIAAYYNTLLASSGIRDLVQWGQDRSQKQRADQLIGRICRSAKLLQYVTEGRRIAPEDLEPPTDGSSEWQPKQGKAPQNYRWETRGNGAHFYYIPIAYLP